MTELERRERHEAEIAAWHELVTGLTAVEYLEALYGPVAVSAPSLWVPGAANDDQASAANDNSHLDEAA
jgi:hypothetical protein